MSEGENQSQNQGELVEKSYASKVEESTNLGTSESHLSVSVGSIIRGTRHYVNTPAAVEIWVDLTASLLLLSASRYATMIVSNTYIPR
jgi:hypothetical protein